MATRFLLFYKKNQDTNLKLAVNVCYSLHGVRKFLRTKIRLYEANWDQKNQRAIYIDRKKAKAAYPKIDFDTMLSLKEAECINTVELGDLRKLILDIENDFIKEFKKSGTRYNAEDVIVELRKRYRPTEKEITEEAKPKNNSLANIVQDFIDRYPKSRQPGSLNVYKNVRRYVLNYEKIYGPIKPEKINKEFFDTFQHYLNTSEKIGNVTAHKQLRGFKTILKDAKNEGLKISDSYKDFKMENVESEIIALTLDEFNTIWALDLSNNKRLDRVRDCFIFSCVSGLRYSDLSRLNRTHIKENQIEITIKKSGKSVPLTIPLVSYSRKILEKYSDQFRPIPIISNVQFNIYLKEIGVLAGMTEVIEKVRFRGNKDYKIQKTRGEFLTVHVGRKTFATLSLFLGAEEWSVRESGGWKSKAFERYVKFSDQRKSELIKGAWDKII